jgi:hypothetical protein
MSISKKITILAVLGATLMASSCKKYLDVNTNPNGAQVATVKTLLPAAQLYLGTAQGVDLEIDGSFFAQYWTQSPGASQYHNLDQYAPGQDAFIYAWNNLYSANENFFQLYKLADSQKAAPYMAISLLMQAYTFQLITDAFGDVPFTQALKGQYADGHIVNPKYDSQMVVYNGILAYIDSANVLLAKNGTPPGADDLVYGGNMAKWQEFGNTLALRIYMRMSEINPSAAAAGIAALYANPTTAVFIGSTAGDDAVIKYGYNSANNNPLYAEEVGLQSYQNFVASNTCLDSLMSNNDPRLYLFYEPVSGSSSFAGLPQGLYNGIPYTGYSFPTVYVAGDAQNLNKTTAFNSGNAPVNFITSYESLFLQAEAAARGWSGAATGQDDSLFYQGIQASFNYYAAQLTDVYGAPATTSIYNDYITGALGTAPGTWTLYPATGSIAQKVQYIIVQKWFAMCGNQGFEAWCEWRRTGYPNWFTYSASSIIGNTFPKRLTYPSNESTVNSSFPGLKPLTQKVWWDSDPADH